MRERRNRVRQDKAAAEADQLRRIVNLHESLGLSWGEAQARVGLVMPHSTFHQRLAKLLKSGVEGLVDHRRPPPSPLTAEIRGFMEGLGQGDAAMSTKSIRARVQERFSVDFSIRTIEEVLQSVGLARPRTRIASKPPVPVPVTTSEPAPQREDREELGGAGLAWLRVASDLSSYGREMAGVVSEVARSLPPPVETIPVDNADRDDKGRFLPEYNAVRERRDEWVGAVFESVDDKRVDKDLTRLSIAGTTVETLENKLLALMALPVVSERGRFNGVTEPRGEWLQSLGTHDYMPETLSKFARELKWAGVSQSLIEKHACLWHGQLGSALGEDASAVVLYVDSTSKPYWTDFFHKSGRVAMVGRVMPCMETALIHTGSGVPLYMKTYAGHVPLVKDVLPLIHQMEAAIGQGMLGRLTVIDGEMNSVALFKKFDADIDPQTGQKGRYFIAPLSHAQVKTLDAVEGLKNLGPYRDGDWIGGGWLDLTDSKEKKAAPYRTRVIVLQRRTKQTFSAFATSVPIDEFSDEELMDTYFHRWPAQEHAIRELNGAVEFKAVHGYGKRRVVNITVVDELTKLKAQCTRLAVRLKKTRADARDAAADTRAVNANNRSRERWEGETQRWMARLSGKDKDNTDEHACADGANRHASAQAEISKLQLDNASRHSEVAQKKVEELEKALAAKKEHVKELASRQEIYQTDVELDQILSVLKLGCALLVQLVLHKFFDGLAIEFNTFLREIVALSGVRIRTETTETIQFRANRRNPKLMATLEQACQRFNALEHQREGRVVHFEVAWPPGDKHHAT